MKAYAELPAKVLTWKKYISSNSMNNIDAGDDKTDLVEIAFTLTFF